MEIARNKKPEDRNEISFNETTNSTGHGLGEKLEKKKLNLLLT